MTIEDLLARYYDRVVSDIYWPVSEKSQTAADVLSGVFECNTLIRTASLNMYAKLWRDEHPDPESQPAIERAIQLAHDEGCAAVINFIKKADCPSLGPEWPFARADLFERLTRYFLQKRRD